MVIGNDAPCEQQCLPREIRKDSHSGTEPNNNIQIWMSTKVMIARPSWKSGEPLLLCRDWKITVATAARKVWESRLNIREIKLGQQWVGCNLVILKDLIDTHHRKRGEGKNEKRKKKKMKRGKKRKKRKIKKRNEKEKSALVRFLWTLTLLGCRRCPGIPGDAVSLASCLYGDVSMAAAWVLNVGAQPREVSVKECICTETPFSGKSWRVFRKPFCRGRDLLDAGSRRPGETL